MASRSLRSRAAELGPAVPWVTLAAALLLGAAFTAELARGVDPWRPTAEQLVAIGGNHGPVAGGGGWRLAIAPLVHLGVLHLAWNLIGLALVVPPLERAIGRAAAALVLVGGAALAGATSVAMAPYSVSVGASGATFAAAVAAAVVALRRRPSELDSRRAIARRVAAFGALNAAAALGALDGAVASWLAPVDQWAHLGGAAAGLAAAGILGRRPGALRLGAAAAALATAVAGVLAAAPAPVDVAGAATRAAGLEQHFDELVPDPAPARAPALGDRIEAEVVAPLAEVRAGLRDDRRMPPALAASAAELRAYLDARLRVLRLFVRYLDTGDASLLPRIEAADRDAAGVLRPPGTGSGRPAAAR
jgi:membrane associated rhomboid family serine protease